MAATPGAGSALSLGAALTRWPTVSIASSTAACALGLPRGLFGFGVGLLRRRHFPGSCFKHLARFLQRRFAALPAFQFGGNVERLLVFLRLGLWRALQELRHFQLQLRNHLTSALIAHRRAFTGVGLHLGAVHADRFRLGSGSKACASCSTLVNAARKAQIEP